jgi:hypothetical protein
MGLSEKHVRFVRDTLSAATEGGGGGGGGGGNMEFFRLVKLYLKRWECSERSSSHPICAFCQFLFAGRRDGEETKMNLKKAKQFADEMPLTASGAIYVWFYTKCIFDMSETEAIEIDPTSVCRHFLSKECGNDTQLSESLAKALELLTTDDIKRLRGVYSVMIDDLKKGGCFGYDKDNESRCIYSNTGTYDLAATTRSLHVDARQYVSPDWVRQCRVPLECFYGDATYMTYQPGIRQYRRDDDDDDDDDEEGESRQSRVRKLPRITSLFEVEGELSPDANDSKSEEEQYRRRMAIYRERSQDLLIELRNLYRLHTLCYDPAIGGTETVRTSFAEAPCLWCSLSISPAARRIFHDLAHVAREKVRAVGMGHSPDCGNGRLVTGNQALTTKFHYGTANECEEEVAKKVPTEHDLRKKGRVDNKRRAARIVASPYDRHSSYSLELDGRGPRTEPVTAVFREWASEKYPFLAEFLEEVGQTDDAATAAALRRHLSPEESQIFCICNNRRVFTDTDCHSKPYHVCLLPFLVQCVQNLVKHTESATAFRLANGKIQQVTARHHMAPRVYI